MALRRWIPFAFLATFEYLILELRKASILADAFDTPLVAVTYMGSVRSRTHHVRHIDLVHREACCCDLLHPSVP